MKSREQKRTKAERRNRAAALYQRKHRRFIVAVGKVWDGGSTLEELGFTGPMVIDGFNVP